MKYYIAYGSNLNTEQMAYRCPDAKPVGLATLKDWKLVFNGVLTIERERGKRVPIGVWKISAADERSLDRYEGYPYLYRKEILPVVIERFDGKRQSTEAIVYVMNSMRRTKYPPSETYYTTVKQGYDDFGFDASILDVAVEESLLA